MNENIKKIRQLISIITHHPLYTKYSLIIIPAASSLVALLIIFLVTVPQVFKLIEKNKEIDQIKQKTVEYQSKAATLDKIDLDYYKTALNDIIYILPSDKEIPSAINSVLDVLSASGLQLTNLTLGASLPSKNGTESFVVNIEVTGNLEQIKNLIAASTNSTRLIKISGISLNTSGKSNIQGTIELLVFYSPLDTTAKISADQKISPLSESDEKLLVQIQENIARNNINTNPTIQNAPTGKDDPFN